ncbi:flagellar hook protein FlgE [Mobilitalea sibirica]|uniref:Flagellar hook protein FlgE n=1 Tax=Mobilitalea sibirica TaxID=1462919 RepID=A0A8J7HDF6_9FIRM|nr:flagellar hook protein FlgE [Mobilitalea sibirica]MBH1941992.1 flagellar hook protein FlgE [Mobilitalea sibirica]
MMRSLFSGVSGLKVHQTKMDVIGNNISNVNTIGFKSSSVTFSDVFYQTTQGASGPNPATGTTGRNAMQIGLGSNVASITSAVTTPGASQRTDNPFDVMIEGDSFFIVNSGGTNYFTKAGSFNVDSFGTLCTPSGASVMGWQVDPNDPTKAEAKAVSPLNIMAPENLYADPEATTEVYISGNIDSKDTQVASETGKMVNITFFDNMGHSYTADMKIWQSQDATNLYNVAITDIKDADGQSIFVNKIVDEETGDVTYEETSIDSFTFGDVEYQVEVEEDGSVTIDTTDASIINFNGSTGAFVSVGDGATPGNSLSFAIDASPNPFSPINIDFSSITMYSTSGSSSLEATKGSLEGIGAGKQVGNMTGVSIDASGKIYGKYDNGDSKLLGQIAVATFSNPAGLEAVGNSMFAATQNSGDFDGIGQDPTQGGGSLTTGVLEMSNVDLSAQFTDMITTQRGFQANSRIITTSDTLLEELINLKR